MSPPPRLRLVFCGTPQFAAPSLTHLLRHPEFEILAVYTQPDRPKGRSQEIIFSPVKKIALAANLPVHQPEKIRAPEVEAHLRAFAPDAIVIIAYGQIIPARLWTSRNSAGSTCTLPCSRNTAALPRFTGPSPTAKLSPATPPCA